MSASEEKPGMDINLDRPRRIRTTLLYWLTLLAVGALLAFLMYRFTGSMLIAIGLAGGMLLYMIIASTITAKNLRQNPGDGRLD